MRLVRPWLYIGKYPDTLDLSTLKQHGIKAVLQLAEAVAQPTIVTLYLPVEDGISLSADYLQQGVAFVLAHKSMGQPVLIACGAGVSRSAAFAVAALKEAENLSLMKAMLALREAHPEALPHSALWDSLCAYYKEPVPWLDMFNAVNAPSPTTANKLVVDATGNDLTYRIIGAAMAVHNKLGPGYKEEVYENALEVELRQRSIASQRQYPVPVHYENEQVALFYLDLFVEGQVVVEIKALSHLLTNDELAQTINYLQAIPAPVGLLLNFGRRKLQHRRVFTPKTSTSVQRAGSDNILKPR